MNPKQPLAEVFGFKITDRSAEARRHRANTLCPFNNNVPECTKDKKDAPLGVCSLFSSGDLPTVICPVRFREKWKVCKDAAEFFFPKGTSWTPLKEIRLKEKSGESAGNIDLVVVAHDERGKISDFGAVEVQAVYVSGNIRRPFEHYMDDQEKNADMDWRSEKHYPRPDYLSSSRKRLVPQLLYKGQILQSWKKKQAVVVDRPFFETLPEMTQVPANKAEICWLVYVLKNSSTGRFELTMDKKVYTGFDSTMKRLATPEIGELSSFVESLEEKLAPVLVELRRDYGVSAFSELLDGRKRTSSRSLDLL
jgi:hypothetical protein